MTNIIRILILSTTFLLINSNCVFSQHGVKAFGIQFKPIFPLSIVNTDGQTAIDQEFGNRLEIKNAGGYSIGAVIRFGLSKRWSIETGINYVKRNYDFELSGEGLKTSTASVSFNGYEIPALAMVFVRLGEKTFMNASGGVTFNLFPTGGLASYDRDTIEYGMLETNWVVPALTTNLGFEYRTDKNGYFYIGSSYHLPFSDIADVFVSYRKPGTNSFVGLMTPPPSVRGSYLTIDIRYFFNSGMKEKRER